MLGHAIPRIGIHKWGSPCSVLLSIQKWFFLPGEQADDGEGPVGSKRLQGCQHRGEDLCHKEHDPTR
jgi:hypothetical protein